MPKPAPPPPPPPVAGHAAWEDYAIPGIDVRLRRFLGPRRSGVPAINPVYQFREALVREIAWAVWPHDDGDWSPSLLCGPKSSGKTTLVEQIAAHCNIPVFRTNMNVGTTVRHLKGRRGARQGGTYFVPGIAVTAMEEGAWLLLDEISGATPPVALSLFPILEPGGEVHLEEAEPPRYVERHPDFRIFATDNTIGAEQEDTRFSYGGTNPEVNEALLDRFLSTVQVGYMEPMQEFTAIKATVPGIPAQELEGMIRVARAVRDADDIEHAFGMRMLIAWARRVASGTLTADGTVIPFSATGDDSYLLEQAGPAFLDRIRSRAERDSICEVIRRVFAIETK
ncbi:MAG: hypothetical protein CMB99_01290 [Flavobacteriaceae bacterium]|nr:hypothetical protein [Flavobacteriaceae bacterium]